VTAPYLKLAEAPTLTIRSPDCNECAVEVTSDGDGWMCLVCGTQWDYDDGEDTPGTLYEEWSGESLEGVPLPPDVAWRVALMPNASERQAKAEELVKKELS
jgi:hypothetical protein